MRTVTFITSDGGGVTIPCPAGKRVRVVSYFAQVTSPTEGDQLAIEYVRSGEVVARVGGPQVPASVLFLQAGLGLAVIEPRQEEIDPVTGVATYSQFFTAVTWGLLDLWWPFEMSIGGTAVGAAVIGPVVVAYETEDV